MANGGMCLALSIATAIWLIRGSVKSGIWMRPSGSSSKLLLLLAMLQSMVQPMDTVLTHVPYARRWVRMCNIGQISISIIGWSKITVASNSGVIPCAALAISRQQLAFVVHLMNDVTLSAFVNAWEKQCLSRHNDKHFVSGSQLCK